MIRMLIRKWSFDNKCDRIGPDLPFTHWRLYFKPLMLKYCQKKFLKFDESAEVRPGVYIIGCSKISIGKRVVLRPGTMLFADPREDGAGITIEDDVLVGSGVHFYVANHNYYDVQRPIIDQGHMSSQGILIKRGSWIGANVVILPGVTIGENTVIGAGSVVTKSVKSGVICGGVPARIIRNIV